jgi:ribonuclease HI
MKFVLYTDGAARGNPGPASIAVVLLDDHGKEIQAFGTYIGRATNNEAEYRALLRGLELAISHQAQALEIRTDSELLALQLKGKYRVRAQNLKSLHEQAQRELARLAHVSIRHIPREQNRLADRLANQALDRAMTDSSRRSTIG